MSRLRPIHFVLALVALATLALATYLTLSRSSPRLPASPAAPPPPPRPASPLADLPPDFLTPLDSPSPSVRSLAAALPNTPATLAAALAERLTTSPRRELLAPAFDCPRTADTLATALAPTTATLPFPTSDFERTMLLGALLRATGSTPEYALYPASPNDATELLARRYAVRAAGSPPSAWIALAPPTSAPPPSPLAPPDLAALLLAHRAKGALARADLGRAEALLAPALALRPDDPTLLALAADLFVAQGDLPAAAKQFRLAAARASDGFTAFRLGEFARAEGAPFDADRHFHDATRLSPALAAPWVSLAELALERIDFTPKSEQPALRAQATRFIQSATTADPHAPGIALVQAHLAALDDHPDEAQAFLESEVRHHPEFATGFIMLANAQVAAEDDAAAIRTLEAALAAGHLDADLLDGLATLYAAHDRIPEARTTLERLLALHPDSPSARPALAHILYAVDAAPDRARALLREHLARFPDDDEAPLLLAQLEIDTQHTDVAQQLIDQVLKRSPTRQDALILAYIARLDAPTPAEAAARDDARRRAVSAAGSPRKLAELLLENGLAAPAELNLLDALQSDPSDLAAPVLLTTLYLATQRPELAHDLRARTLATAPREQRSTLEALFDDAARQVLGPPPSPSTP